LSSFFIGSISGPYLTVGNGGGGGAGGAKNSDML
jgi:hypothetical protein